MYIYLLCLLFNVSGYIYSSQAKQCESPKAAKKSKPKKSVGFKETEPEKIMIATEHTILGQMANLPKAADFEAANYIQNELLVDAEQAQKQLDAIAEKIMANQAELANEETATNVRFEGFSKRLRELSKVFSHTLPKNAWGAYELKKYSLLAQQYNRLLNTPELISKEINGMITDLFEIAPE